MYHNEDAHFLSTAPSADAGLAPTPSVSGGRGQVACMPLGRSSRPSKLRWVGRCMTVLAVTLGAALPGCATTTPFVWASSLPAEPPPAANLAASPVSPGDTIAVAVRGHDSLAGNQVVGLDGFIVIPLVGAVHVAGMTPDGIAKELEERLRVSIEAPRVSVVLMEQRREVTVLGEVTRPGKYAVNSRDDVTAALALAGGLTEFADVDSIYLVRPGSPRIRFRMQDLVAGGDAGPRIRLRDGDLVVIE